MQVITPTVVEQHLKAYPLPPLNQEVISVGWLQSVDIEKNSLSLQLKVGFPLGPTKIQWQKDLTQFLKQQLPELQNIIIHIESQIRSHAVQPGLSPLPSVKNVIAVASGKGGVGKSTTAVNLALSLLLEGARVGILDADIYGPNQPHMLGANTRPHIRDDKKIMPILAHGLQTISMGNLIDAITPMVWRGL